MNALISVANKTGIVEFAERLSSIGINLISTGGTYDIIKKSNIPVKNILDITTCGKKVDKIIKTLYPEIYAGISYNRDDCEQCSQLEEANIESIDIVIVNLSRFQDTVLDNSLSFLKNIDIGGPTMLRTAAQNYKDVIVICDPNDYNKIFHELKNTHQISIETRIYLIKKVFQTTFEYENEILKYL